MTGYYVNALNDIRSAGSSWRVWTMLASNDIKQRYRRSALGQFWLTLSMAILIFGMGIVYSILFKTDVKTYIPYVATTFVMWAFISSNILESTSAFVDNERIILHISIAKSTFMFRMIYRNLLVLCHNVLIIPLVFVVFQVGINWNILWLIPGFFLVALNCFWIGYCAAIICARYRDVPQIIASLMQIMFFVTPIMFKPGQLGEHSYILYANPLASFLEVLRNPILGEPPSALALAICVALLVVGSLIMLAFAGKYSQRVVYWL
jgi:homopolymeric O-antigen transport system permease protein